MLDLMKKMRRMPETSVSIREALAEVDAAIPIATEKAVAADKSRAELLLSGTDAQVVAAEAETSTARIALDRLTAARCELERHLVETEAAEAMGALDTERAMVEAKAAKIAARLRREYEQHAGSLAGLLAELAAAEDAVSSINRKLYDAGRSDTLPPVEERAIPAGRNSVDVAGLRALTALRPIGSSPGWGAGRQAASILGLEV